MVPPLSAVVEECRRAKPKVNKHKEVPCSSLLHRLGIKLKHKRIVSLILDDMAHSIAAHVVTLPICYRTQESIGRTTHISVETIKRCIKKLAADGIINIQRVKRNGEAQNSYIINPAHPYFDALMQYVNRRSKAYRMYEKQPKGYLPVRMQLRRHRIIAEDEGVPFLPLSTKRKKGVNVKNQENSQKKDEIDTYHVRKSVNVRRGTTCTGLKAIFQIAKFKDTKIEKERNIAIHEEKQSTNNDETAAKGAAYICVDAHNQAGCSHLGTANGTTTATAHKNNENNNIIIEGSGLFSPVLFRILSANALDFSDSLLSNGDMIMFDTDASSLKAEYDKFRCESRPKMPIIASKPLLERKTGDKRTDSVLTVTTAACNELWAYYREMLKKYFPDKYMPARCGGRHAAHLKNIIRYCELDMQKAKECVAFAFVRWSDLAPRLCEISDYPTVYILDTLKEQLVNKTVRKSRVKNVVLPAAKLPNDHPHITSFCGRLNRLSKKDRINELLAIKKSGLVNDITVTLMALYADEIQEAENAGTRMP